MTLPVPVTTQAMTGKDGLPTSEYRRFLDSMQRGTKRNEAAVAAVQSSLADYAPLASPALTGTPTAPTADPDDDSTQIATTAFVQSVVADSASTWELLDQQSLSGDPFSITGLPLRAEYYVEVAGASAGNANTFSLRVGTGATPSYTTIVSASTSGAGGTVNLVAHIHNPSSGAYKPGSWYSVGTASPVNSAGIIVTAADNITAFEVDLSVPNSLDAGTISIYGR